MKNRFDDIQNTKSNLDVERDWRQMEFSYPERTVRLATSFSGIGAIEHSFHRLGLKCQIQFAGDIDANCKKAYFANYPITEQQWHTDVHDFDAKPYKGKVDLFVGGAPCQAFSLRGKHGGFEDTRGTLFREFARIVIECQPKVFIFENVKGMLSHDKGKTWNVIKETFENDCGYQVYFQVLNAKDYGIPQSRDRIYCIGFKQETEFKYPAPIALEKSMYDFLDVEFDKKYLLKSKGAQFVTRSINYQKSYTQVNGDVALCQKRNQQFNWHGDFVFQSEEDAKEKEIPELEKYFLSEKVVKYVMATGTKNFYSKPKTDLDIARPLLTTMHKMHRAGVDNYVTTDGRLRKLTPRECLRLMGFSDNFKIVVSDTSMYQQAGNSIVVDVLIHIMNKVIESCPSLVEEE